MKTGICIAVFGVVLSMASAVQAQIVAQAALIGTIQVKEISVVEINSSQVKVSMNLGLVPARSATLKNIRLCSLRLNGQPVFAAPLNQEIVLEKGVTTALPPLYVTMLFRDLSSVEPLSQMIDKQSVHLEGELVADLRLNFMEKLALATLHPKAEITLDQEVPAHIDDTPLLRIAARSVLAIVETALKTKSAAAHYVPDVRPGWIRDLEARAQSDVLIVESSYTIKQRGIYYPVHVGQLGFRLASGEIVTTAEADAPWKYDADFMGAMKSGEAKLEKKSQDIVLAPVNTNNATLSLSGKDFSLIMRGTPEQDSITLSDRSHGQVKVLRRDSPGSLAILTTHASISSPGLAAATAEMVAQNRWEQVAVFRLRIDQITKTSSLEILTLSAYREGKSIRLAVPVDSAVFGSPIVTPDGVIGLVQDEQVGTFLPADVLTPASGAVW